MKYNLTNVIVCNINLSYSLSPLAWWTYSQAFVCIFATPFLLPLLSLDSTFSLVHFHIRTLCINIYVQTNSILIHSFCIYFQLAATQFMECIWRVSIENVIWNIYIWITGKSNGFFPSNSCKKSVQMKAKKANLICSAVKNHRNLMNT